MEVETKDFKINSWDFVPGMVKELLSWLVQQSRRNPTEDRSKFTTLPSPFCCFTGRVLFASAYSKPGDSRHGSLSGTILRHSVKSNTYLFSEDEPFLTEEGLHGPGSSSAGQLRILSVDRGIDAFERYAFLEEGQVMQQLIWPGLLLVINQVSSFGRSQILR